MEKQERRCRRLVLVPLPLQGHINPMLQLGTVLHSKGFSITVAHTQFNFPDTSNHPDFIFQPLSDGTSSKPKSAEDLLPFLSNINLNCRAPLLEVLSHIIEKQQQDDQLPCIIYDGFMYFTESVADLLKLPSIILQTRTAAHVLAYNALPRLQEEGYIPPKDTESLELVPGLHPLRFRDLPTKNFKNLDALFQLMPKMQNTGSSSAIIWNSMDCLEGSSLAQFQQQCQVPNFPIGPMHKIVPASSSSLLEEDTSCITWLDKQAHNSVIYVSFGSIALVDAKEVAEMAWGLANSKQPFLWVLRPGSINGSESTDLLPDGFGESVGERGCIVKWAPQEKVLAHNAVGGFWTHCGWNSTIESISEGVPMICRPSFGDQKVNARYISYVWGTGFELENDLDREEIERAVKRLMVEKEGEEMRQRALDLKEKSEICIKKGGSSFNSLNELIELIMSV